MWSDVMFKSHNYVASEVIIDTFVNKLREMT